MYHKKSHPKQSPKCNPRHYVRLRSASGPRLGRINQGELVQGAEILTPIYQYIENYMVALVAVGDYLKLWIIAVVFSLRGYEWVMALLFGTWDA
jgi:hypothetical protein